MPPSPSGRRRSRESYLDVDRILAAAAPPAPKRSIPATASSARTPTFAERLEPQGIRFIGPTPEQIRAIRPEARRARAARRGAGVPLLPGTRCSTTSTPRSREAERIGYPVMLKSTAGGGGIGMQRCHDAGELAPSFESVAAAEPQQLQRRRRVSSSSFVERARHVEVQIFGDGAGGVARARRARLLAAAAPPEGRRGDAGAAASRRDAAPRCMPRPCASAEPVALPLGGHGRVRLRRRRATRSTSSR